MPTNTTTISKYAISSAKRSITILSERLHLFVSVLFKARKYNVGIYKITYSDFKYSNLLVSPKEIKHGKGVNKEII